VNKGSYPQDVIDRLSLDMGFVDFWRYADHRRPPLDFLGVNYYTRHIARSEDIPESQNAKQTLFRRPGAHRDGVGGASESLYVLLDAAGAGLLLRELLHHRERLRLRG